jgi:hypothetical protein
MRKILMIPALAAAALAGPAAAQSPEAEVLEVVHRVFEGMRTADTTMMRSTFHPDIRLISTGERDGQPVVRVSPAEAWLEGVAGAGRVLDEQLYEPEVRVDGNLATVWTFYTLHVDGELSHCGMDAFQLALTADGWKITQVADTRRREGCDPPAGAGDAGDPDEGRTP